MYAYYLEIRNMTSLSMKVHRMKELHWHLGKILSNFNDITLQTTKSYLIKFGFFSKDYGQIIIESSLEIVYV